MPNINLSIPDYIVLIVEDLERSLEFYTVVLGLTLGHRSGPFAQLDTGATRVALFEREAMGETLGFPIVSPSELAPAFELGFKVSDVDETFTELVDRGAEPATTPTTRHWGQRTAYIKDPDGNLIELAQDLVRH